MEIEKDLTPELEKQEAKDRIYQVKGTLKFLPAPQDPKTARPYSYKKTGWGSIERIEAHLAGTPTTTTSPLRRKKIRTGEGEIKTGGCHSFAVDSEGRVLVPWGGYGGLFKSSWRRTLQAKAARDWEYPKADLIKCYPLKLRVAGPIDSQTNGQEPLVVLTTRHTGRGDVMVEEFFDWIKDRPIEFYLEVDSESPINEERNGSQICTQTSKHPQKHALKLLSIQPVQLASKVPLRNLSECSSPSTHWTVSGHQRKAHCKSRRFNRSGSQPKSCEKSEHKFSQTRNHGNAYPNIHTYKLPFFIPNSSPSHGLPEKSVQ